MKYTKLLLSLFTLSLFALPCSAWEQSFENHANDEPLNLFTGDFSLSSNGDSTVFINGHGNWYYFNFNNIGGYRYLNINKPFDGYLAFDLYIRPSTTQTDSCAITLYNSSGVAYISDRVIFSQNLAGQTTHIKRLEIIETGAGTGIEYYVDGVYIGSTAYIASPSPGYIRLGLRTPSSSNNAFMAIDNICSGYAMVGCDQSFTSETDQAQYYSASFPFPIDSYMFCRVYAPNNSVIQTQNVSIGSEYSISSNLIQEGGTYSIKLFQHDNLTNTDYYFAGRTFIFNKPSGKSIVLDKEEYSPGDQVQIFTYMPTFQTGHKVSISYKTASGLTAYTYDVLSADQTKTWVLPSTAQGGTFFAYFRDPNNNVVASDSFYVTAPLGATEIYVDKSIYENNDTIKISYKYLPENTRIDLYLKSGSTNIFTTNWMQLSGSGVKTFNISGRAADSVYIKATQGDIFEGKIVGEASAKILSGEYFLSGKVYDSSSGVPIPGATIYVGGSSTVTNALGYYEMSVIAGSQPVSIVKDGFNQYTGNILVHSLSQSQNFYLVKTLTTGSNTLYGTITDYYTGAPLNSTYIQIKQDSTVYSMLSHAKTGNYMFSQEGLTGEWEVTVTRTGYDSHTRMITINGDTYLSIKLVPIGGSPGYPSDPSNPADPTNPPGGSTGSTERPGRESARESMNQFEAMIPGLMGIVVLRVLMELLG